jgi:hypothetical protein
MDALLFPDCLLGAADLRPDVFKLIIKLCIIVGILSEREKFLGRGGDFSFSPE